MSLEAITKIRAVEEGMEQSKAEARSQVQRMIAEADRDGRAALERGRIAAGEAAAAAMSRAEAEAAKRREEILCKAAEDCAALKAEAAKRMDTATQAILGRVVES